MVTVCILWFGGHTDVGLQVTVPSAHGAVPSPWVLFPGDAEAGMAIAAAATAAAPRARRLLTFKVPPGGKASPRGRDDAGAAFPSPSAPQVLHSKFRQSTHFGG